MDAVRGPFGGGLGVSPILRGLSRLFGGGGDSTESVISPRFSLPTRLEVVAGQAANQAAPFALEYGQGQVARPVSRQAPSITVQVQAMDSQSFLDRSQDIAKAVRLAMLDSGVLTDLIREV